MKQSNWQSNLAFKQGLEFGNPEQIQYLKAINFQEECEEAKREQGLQPYKVTISEERFFEVYVWAEDEDDAGEAALEQLDDSDWDEVDRDVRICSMDAGES